MERVSKPLQMSLTLLQLLFNIFPLLLFSPSGVLVLSICLSKFGASEAPDQPTYLSCGFQSPHRVYPLGGSLRLYKLSYLNIFK